MARSSRNRQRTRRREANRRLPPSFNFRSEPLKQLTLPKKAAWSPPIGRNPFQSNWKRVEHAPNVNNTRPPVSTFKAAVIAPLTSVSALPERTRMCVQRAQRTEVLHAIGKAGKTGQKRPVWTQKSKIRCK